MVFQDINDHVVVVVLKCAGERRVRNLVKCIVTGGEDLRLMSMTAVSTGGCEKKRGESYRNTLIRRQLGQDGRVFLIIMKAISDPRM